MSTAHEANTTFSENIRTKNHTIDPKLHPHLDGNSLSSRVRDITGLRPTPPTLVEMMVHEAKAFSREDFAALIEGLKAIEPTPQPAN